ncbi:hypothetical protein L484_002435 [Morus notabilis]|uniref:Bifunctional inhibitor/plant lipid transfer protein/seed storage helical domain-containing protein n=1 Tax=Morus notabilis TaxID=981085 RepID=W9QKS2_9ROSA|nr:non-specific lipid transfer protein-like 1 [Morus notabilis]EXB22121.1 hypothetical protein L484_002435 [Morus notabilis]
MELGLKAFKSSAILWGYILVVALSMTLSVNGQICTASMVSTFTPCLNFVTGSSNNGSLPSTGCCSSLKSILSTSVDCACLLITANVPVQLPINRTLAISLPRVCNMDNVPTQCKPAGAPLPAPGSAFLGPTPAAPTGIADSPFSPQASEEVETAPAPESETTDHEQLMPIVSAPVESEGPSPTTANAGIRPVLKSPASSGSCLSYVFPAYLLHIAIGAMFFISY